MTKSPNAPENIVGLALAMQASPGRYALLLGSGISWTSGIPTGWAVVGDLVGRVAVADGEPGPPPDPIAWYFERFGCLPDYSTLLASLAPTSAQRRDLLASYFEPTDEDRSAQRKVPTSAHRAIAELVRRGTIRVVITTNFDRLLEQALQAVGIDPVVVATAAAAQGTIPLAHSRCTVIKVHGDYLDPNIKNTVGELEHYEPGLDTLLDRAFDEYGLVVCGWSAQWDPALRNAIDRCPTRRYGTYWTDMNGLAPEAERLITNRSADRVKIEDADIFFESLLSKVEALDDLKSRNTNDLDVVVAEAKRFLPDPAFRIRLHDLTMDSADRSLASIDFDGNVTPGDGREAAYLAKAKTIEHASAHIIGVIGVLAQFADRADQHELIVQVLKKLALPAGDSLSGTTVWIKLRGYPALLAFYAVGLCATANDKWDTLALALETEVRDRRLGDGSAMTQIAESLSTWNVLSDEVINGAFGERRRTPVSDYLHDCLYAMLGPNLRMSSDQFEIVFDEWEYLLGLLVTDSRGRGPIGRYVWRSRFWDEHRFPNRAVVAMESQMLARGFFEGSADRLAGTAAKYNETIVQSGLRS